MEFYWIGIAFLAGATAQLLNLPTLVGYIAAGLVLALFGVEAGNFIVEVGDVGIMLLLFTVGLHIRLRNVIQKEVLGAGGLHLVFSVIIFTVVGLGVGLSLNAAILLAAALGFSSTVLTAKGLESRGELDAYNGRVAMGILILQDIVAIGLLAATGTETPQIWAVGLLALPLLRPIMFRMLESFAQEEMVLVIGLLLAFGIGEVFELAGVGAKLGALFAGIMLSEHPSAEVLYDKLWALKEVFLIGFFLQVGLAGVPEIENLLLSGLLLILLPIKTVLFFILLVRFDLRSRTAFITSLSLTAYSEFALIVATAAVEADLIPTEWLTTLALTVALSFAINALLGRAGNFLWLNLESYLTPYERQNVEHPDTQPRYLGSTNYLILGMGRVGTAAYDYLVEAGKRPIGLDADPGKIERHLSEGRRVLFGDSQDPELWKNLRMNKIEAVILAIPNVERKVSVSKMLRENGYHNKISALVRDDEHPEDLLEVGVNSLSLPLTQAGHELAEMSLPA